MKRMLVTVLVLSMFAFPLFAGKVKEQKLVGVTNSRVLSLEHSDGMWRMLIRCDEGVGTISFVDTGKHTFYRGSGCFSSWSQEQMSATYTALIPQDDSPALELPQLG